MKILLPALVLLALTGPAWSAEGERWACTTDKGVLHYEISGGFLLEYEFTKGPGSAAYDIDEDTSDRISASRLVSKHKVSLLLDKKNGHFQTRMRINSYRENHDGSCQRVTG